MTSEQSQGAAAFTTLEILCRLLAKKGTIQLAEFTKEMERYAQMHDTAKVGGFRSPNDPEVASCIRQLAKATALP